MPKVLKGFKDFVLRGNSVDLAVGIVIGASFNEVISTLVKNLLTPFVAAVFRIPNFAGLSFIMNNKEIIYGNFLNALISFALVAVAVYFLVITPMSTLRNKFMGPVVPKSKKCQECFSDIPLKAVRCAFCTRMIK